MQPQGNKIADYLADKAIGRAIVSEYKLNKITTWASDVVGWKPVMEQRANQ